MNPVYPILEITASALFLVAVGAAFLRGRLALLTLISAAAFGILLEEGDQLIFETYHYSEEWFLALDRAPVAIGLVWALIITGAMRITDALGVRRVYAPFVDSLIALSLDIAFDAIAIRMGLWTWRGVEADAGWFGVPAGNFYSWLFVTLAFSLVTRWLAELARRRPVLEWLQLLVPLPAFAILLAGIIPFAVLQEAFDPEPGGGMAFFVVTLAAFIVVAAVGLRRRERPPAEAPPPRETDAAAFELRFGFFTRLAIHAFFLLALFVMGLHAREPVLLIVALAMLALEVPLGWVAAQRPAASEPAPSAVPRAPEPRRSPDPS